jgi:hypothetical protein
MSQRTFCFRTTNACLHVGQSSIFWTLFFAQYSSGFLVWCHNFEVITATTLIHHDGHSHHPVVFRVMVSLLNGNARLVLSTLVSEIIYFYIYKVFPLMTWVLMLSKMYSFGSREEFTLPYFEIFCWWWWCWYNSVFLKSCHFIFCRFN